MLLLDKIPLPASSILLRNCWLVGVCLIPRSLQELRDDSLSIIGCIHKFVGTSGSTTDCGGNIKPPAFSLERVKDIGPVDPGIDRLSGLVCGCSRLDWSSNNDLGPDTLDIPTILPDSCFKPSSVFLVESGSIDSLSDNLFLSTASATFARADSFGIWKLVSNCFIRPSITNCGGRLGGRFDMDACAANNLNARSLSLSSRKPDGLDFLASARAFDTNTLLSPDFVIRGLSRLRLRSVAPELLVFGEPEDLDDEPLFDNGFPLPTATAVAALTGFAAPEEMADLMLPAASIILPGINF